MGGMVIFQLILLAASTVYQMQAQKKAKKKAKAAREAAAAAAKDNAARRDIKISGSNDSIPLIYGEVRRVPTTVYTNVDSDFDLVAANSEEVLLGSLATFAGSKNETLISQVVLSGGGIEDVVHVEVDDGDYDDAEYDAFVALYVNKVGGTINTSTTLGRLSTATFDDLSYATEYFKMNRDDPQFGGRPSTAYFLKGKKIRTYTGTVLSAGTSYSFNTIEVLLDYLMDTVVGPGLQLGTDIHNDSFAAAAAIAAEIVMPNIPIEGRFGSGTRDLARHEFHGMISPANDHLDNLDTILDTIPGAILLRDAAGLIKINIPNPGIESPTASAALSVGTVTEDVLLSDIQYAQQDTASRLNRLSLSYVNVAKDMVSDSFDFTNSTYLAEDQGVVLATDLPMQGVNNEYHASGICKASINESRLATYKFSAAYEFLRYEPGDIVRLTSDRNDIDTYIRISSVDMKNNYEVEVNALAYDSSAWFFDSETIVNTTTNLNIDMTLEAPTGVTAVLVDNVNSLTSSVKIAWTSPDDISAAYIEVEARMDTGSGIEWSNIGTVLGHIEHFIYAPNFMTNYTFRVRSRTRLGRFSDYATAAPLDVTSTILKNLIQFDIESPQNVVKRNLVTGVTAPVSLSNDFSVYFGVDIATYDASATMPAHSWKMASPLSDDLPNASQGSYAISVAANVGTVVTTLDQTANSTYLASYVLLQIKVNPTENALADTDPAILTFNKYIYITEMSDGISTRSLTVYKLASSIPTTPTGGSYEFFSATLTPPAGWSEAFLENADPTLLLYASVATANLASGVGTTDSNLTWSTPLVHIRNGNRGAGWFRTYEAVNQATLDGYSSATVDAKFQLLTGSIAFEDDRFIIGGIAPAVKAWIYQSGTWNAQAAFIDGGLLVDGTVTADHLAANSVTASKILADEIDTVHLKAYSVETTVLNGSAVTTAKVNDDAITVNDMFNNEASISTTTGYVEIASVTITSDGSPRHITGSCRTYVNTTPEFWDFPIMRLKRAGVVVRTWDCDGSDYTQQAVAYGDTTGSGSITYSLEVYGDGNVTLRTMLVTELKK
jgi:hypothetical protein